MRRPTDNRSRSGPRLVRPAALPDSQWYFARLCEDLTASGPVEADLYMSDDPPSDDPSLSDHRVLVYAFFLDDALFYPADTDVEIKYHPQYQRWYVTNAPCS